MIRLNPMRTRSLLIGVALFTLIMMGLGVAFAPFDNTPAGYVHLGFYNLGQTLSFMGKWMLRAVFGGLLWFIMLVATSPAHGVHSLADAKRFFELPHNDSHSVLFGRLFVGCMAVAGWAPMTTITAYIANVLYRGGLVLLVSVAVATAFAYLLNVRSVGDFQHWLTEPSNDSHVRFLSEVLLGIILLAAFA